MFPLSRLAPSLPLSLPFTLNFLPRPGFSRDEGAGGKLNDFVPKIGRKSLASKQRDDQLIAGLGGGGGAVARDVAAVVAGGRDRAGRPRGSALSQQQKDVVKQVSTNVSEELAERLLVPTPGARALLGTMVQEKDRAEKEKAGYTALTAKQLLLSHKNSLTPTLGRGLGLGAEVCLDMSPSVKARYNEAGHAKALAILALRKKGIAKTDPNQGHRSKGRQEDIQEKVKKRMRSEEEEDGSQDSGAENGVKKARKAPETVTVFGKEVDVAKLEELRNKKSANSHLVEEAELDAADRYFEKAEKKDAMEEKMLSTTSIAVKAVTCHLCNYTSFKASELCRYRHNMESSP